MAQDKIKSPVTGTVLQVVAAAGDQLDGNATVLLAESMKVEIPVTMPRAGRVKRIAVAAGDGITEGQTLAEIE